jgi:hypothetical protein
MIGNWLANGRCRIAGVPMLLTIGAHLLFGFGWRLFVPNCLVEISAPGLHCGASDRQAMDSYATIGRLALPLIVSWRPAKGGKLVGGGRTAPLGA